MASFRLFCLAGIFAITACDIEPLSPSAHRPASIVVVSGNSQDAIAGNELAEPLVVRVVDAAGEPVAGQVVTFRVLRGSGALFAGTLPSGTDGLVQERWTLGVSAADSQVVEARGVDPTTGMPLIIAVFGPSAVAGPAASMDANDQACGRARAFSPTSNLQPVTHSNLQPPTSRSLLSPFSRPTFALLTPRRPPGTLKG